MLVALLSSHPLHPLPYTQVVVVTPKMPPIIAKCPLGVGLPDIENKKRNRGLVKFEFQISKESFYYSIWDILIVKKSLIAYPKFKCNRAFGNPTWGRKITSS